MGHCEIMSFNFKLSLNPYLAKENFDRSGIVHGAVVIKIRAQRADAHLLHHSMPLDVNWMCRGKVS